MAKYGPHVVMDLVGCNPKKIKDARFIYKFMSELPEKIGMKKMGEPHMDMYTGINEEWGGFSSNIFIQTSHISFHFFDWGYVFGDIFSCRDFDFENAVKMIMEELEVDQHQPDFVYPEKIESIEALEFLKNKKSEWKVSSRGFNFPPSLNSKEI